MASVKDKAVLQNDIVTALADNNAGLISAQDVRDNMDNIVESMANIVAKSDMNVTNPFQSNVRAKIVAGTNGEFIAESGVRFSSIGGDNLQLVPYPGNDRVDHNLLDNLAIGDVHTQYLNVNGQRKMEGNLGLDDYWLNSAGNNDGNNATTDRGIQFEYVAVDDIEKVHIGNKSVIEFDEDASTVNSSKGVAKAWVNFDASNGIVINAGYNIASIQTSADGKFIINFKNPIPVPYVALGNSNSTTGNSNNTDFDLNTVGIVERTTNYVSFVIRNDNGEYVNAKVNDLVIFGLSNDNEIADLVTTTQAP